MKEMSVNYRNQTVKILLGENLLERTCFPTGVKYFILTDDNVGPLYLKKLINEIPNANYLVLPSGEGSKDTVNVLNIIGMLLELEFSKGDYFIALGGGVITDLSGFIASIYKRGMKMISIPTSLLGQVDSALGGKTGVNYSKDQLTFKNQIGTIYHPEMILIDPNFLKTLPKAEFRSGLGEIIKYGLCFDQELFYQLFESFSLTEIILPCLEIKAEVTLLDEFENSERKLLNYGHTIGHALESLSGFSLRHGEAIALGMLYETEDPLIKNELKRLYKLFDFPGFEFSRMDLITYLKQDKKISRGRIQLPVLEEIGKVCLKEIDLEELLRRI
jgi:3-dehydroquinate synthase